MRKGWVGGGVGLVAEEMSREGGGGKPGRKSEQGQLNNHYQAARESLAGCVWDQIKTHT